MQGVLKLFRDMVAPERGDFSVALANEVLTMKLKPEHEARIAELSSKAQVGAASAQEKWELEQGLFAIGFIELLKEKAARSLEQAASEEKGKA